MKKLLLSASVGLLAVTAAQQANAAGFYIQEQSIKGLGSAFAGSATSIDDASTVYFNAARMTQLDGAQINAAVNVLIPDADIKDNGSTGLSAGGVNPDNPYDAEVVPNFFAATPILEERAWLGFGVTAPFGLANDYGETWFGRYDSTSTQLTTIDFQPSVAFKATDWISVGLGINIQHASGDLQSMTFAAGQDRPTVLRGKDISFGYTASVVATPFEDWEFGANYRSGITHELDGSFRIDGVTNTSGLATLGLPDIATFGAAYDVNEELRLMAQATWFGWNNFENILVRNDAGGLITRIDQGYQTTWAFAIGAEYELNDDWTVRGGYQFDETPTVDEFRTSRTPDGDRNWFSLGATYKLRDNLEIDAAATYIDISDETISLSRNSGAAGVNATTEGSVGILALGVNYKF